MNQRSYKKLSLTAKNGRIHVKIKTNRTAVRKKGKIFIFLIMSIMIEKMCMYYTLPNIKLSTVKFDQICNKKLCT